MATRRRKKRAPRRRKIDPMARERAFEVLYYMRAKGFSLTKAAHELHTTPETVRLALGSVVYKKRGRWVAKPSDRFRRRMLFLTKDGMIEGSVQGSRQASLIAGHIAAVVSFLGGSGTEALRKFKGKTVRVSGVVLPFITDPKKLVRLQLAGEPAFDRLYARRV